MQDYHSEIATLTRTTISKNSAENYTPQLKFLGINTLKQFQELLHKQKDLALKIAVKSIKDKGAEELPLDIGIRLLCFAKIISDDMPVEKVAEYSDLSLLDHNLATRQAQRLLALKKIL